MKKQKIATVINYCTNDYRFLRLCIHAVRPFSSQVIIPVCDHFFNGQKEDRSSLKQSYSAHPDCHFIEFAYSEYSPYGIYCPVKASDEDWIHFWHSTARYIGFLFTHTETEYVLFIDVDEIFDTERFIQWLKVFPYNQYNAMRFCSYFYFREPCFRAKSFTNNALMVKKSAIESPEILLSIYERKGTFESIQGTKMNGILGLDNFPIVHHYSWVRPKEELLFKAKSWGHHHEKDWSTLIEEEFSKPFSGTESLYRMQYETVEPSYNPLKEMSSITKDDSYVDFSHVSVVNPAYMKKFIYNLI